MRREEPPNKWSTPGAGSTGSRLAALHAAVFSLVDSSLVGCSSVEIASDLCALTRLHAQVTSQLLRYAAEADRRVVGAETGATSTAAWWAHSTKPTRPEANRMVALARALEEPERASSATTFAAGGVLTDQAHVITQAVTTIPTELGSEVRGKGRSVPARRGQGSRCEVATRPWPRILDIVALQVSEEHEERLLLAEERAADTAVRLTMTGDGHGRTHGRFTLPTAQAQMFRQPLSALANPRRLPNAGDQAASDESEREMSRPRPERLGRAILEYIECYPTDYAPDGSTPPHSGSRSTFATAAARRTVVIEHLEAVTPTTNCSGHKVGQLRWTKVACCVRDTTGLRTTRRTS